MQPDKQTEFRDYAAKELTVLAERLTKAATAAAERAAEAAADEGRQVLDALRAQMQAELKTLAEDAQKAGDTLRAELQSTVKQKTALAASLEETQTQLDGLRVELASTREDADSLRGELRSAHDEIASVRNDLASTADALASSRRESDDLTGTLEHTRGELEAARSELKAATERGQIASSQLADARQANEKLEVLRDELTLARDEEARGRAAAEADLRKTREQLQIASAALAAAETTLEKAAGDRAALEETISIAHSQTEAAEAKLAAVTDLFNKSAARVKVLERAQQDHERTVQDLEARIKTPAAAPAAADPAPLFDELLSGFQALESAATMSDVLTTFVEQLAAQFARVALFRVRKSHLQGEHQIGFDLKTDIAKVVLPLGMDSLPARAVSSGLIERLSGDELTDGAGVPFSGAPRFALAIPVIAAGETLAVVYADDAGAKSRKAADASVVSARFAEAMQYHAVALLMRMTNELKARAELQAYAQSLLRELEEMYAADEQGGKQGDELQTRLQGNLEYARSIFDSRVALEGGGAAALLDDEIGALLESTPDTSFARHLAAASGRTVKTRNTAEAS